MCAAQQGATREEQAQAAGVTLATLQAALREDPGLYADLEPPSPERPSAVVVMPMVPRAGVARGESAGKPELVSMEDFIAWAWQLARDSSEHPGLRAKCSSYVFEAVARPVLDERARVANATPVEGGVVRVEYPAKEPIPDEHAG